MHHQQDEELVSRIQKVATCPWNKQTWDNFIKCWHKACQIKTNIKIKSSSKGYGGATIDNMTESYRACHDVVEEIIDIYGNAMSALFTHIAGTNKQIAILQQAVNNLNQTMWNWQMNMVQQQYTNQTLGWMRVEWERPGFSSYQWFIFLRTIIKSEKRENIVHFIFKIKLMSCLCQVWCGFFWIMLELME